MPNPTNTTAFEINNINNSGTRFTMEVIYYYNYNASNDTYTNSQVYFHNLPIEEFNCQCDNDLISNVSSCELNGKNKCFFRYTEDMIDKSDTYGNPLALYQYIVNNLV
jgi:hypothetical protein